MQEFRRSRARAPVRVDPGGGGTDAPPFSVEHGGTVVNFAIERHASASVDRLPQKSGVIIYSEDLAEGLSVSDVSALPGRGSLEFPKGGGTVAHRLDVAEDVRLALEHNSLLVYTSEAHVSGNIHRDIKDSYGREGSSTVDAMIRLRESAKAMAASLARGNMDGYVEAMTESCQNLYRLHPSCDSEAHRRYFRELGGLISGGKTCGAGGGGFLLVYTRPGRRRECRLRAEQLGG